MQRTQTKTQISESRYLYKVKYVLEADASLSSRQNAAYQALEQLVGSPGLLNAGPVFFQKMRMSWTGENWTIEIEGEE